MSGSSIFAGRFPVAARQGRMPPTMENVVMASHSLTIARYGGGKAVPLPNGGAVAPGELIRATVTGIGSLVDPTVKFRLLGVDGAPLLEQAKNPALFSSQVVFDFNAPVKEGVFTLEAWLHSFPLLPQQHKATTVFRVAKGAPEQEAPPSGGGFGGFGDIKSLAWIALGIVALVAVMPIVKRVTAK